MYYEKYSSNTQKIFCKSLMLKAHYFNDQTEKTDFHQSRENRAEDLSKRTLIIVPGYSVSNPPRIGDHRYYIQALQYHPTNNPKGYKKIFVFDLYSKKDGRCNFQHDITMLAAELLKSIETSRDNWVFSENGEIDFIGGSMGGLIVRKFIQDYMIGENQIATKSWGTLRIKNIILIATPNYGCKIIDFLQNPIIQLLLRIKFGKNNFSQSLQIQQISVGRINIWEPIFRNLIKKHTPVNIFLERLNSTIQTPGNIRWITIHGSKRSWVSRLLYNKNNVNDGVVEANSVSLTGAENISDKDFGIGLSWNHRDLYENEGFCNLLAGLLIFNMRVIDYQENNHLIFNHKISSNKKNRERHSQEIMSRLVPIH
ncbi:MAG: hypothetical protein KGD59_08580 [Candidatus Heimdallarchaeota archaeon]|nr:hypothetical protein [Candidatus Heimdallarchaeota archaeon]MBY8994592.1 hypothetical protein [Candidatus Heimdallarchaeota archaeon]